MIQPTRICLTESGIDRSRVKTRLIFSGKGTFCYISSHVNHSLDSEMNRLMNG